jgi:hypothetical protein
MKAKIERINEIEHILTAKETENVQLNEQVKINIGWMEKACNLERQLHLTASDLFVSLSKNEELLNSVAKLTKELAACYKRVQQYEMRAQSVEKWISSFSLSMHGWKESQDLLEDGVASDSEEMLVTGSHMSEIDD